MGQPLDQVMGPIRAEAAVFVTMHSPDSQDLLPGLCLLTEKWLHRVSIPAVACKTGAVLVHACWRGYCPELSGIRGKAFATVCLLSRSARGHLSHPCSWCTTLLKSCLLLSHASVKITQLIIPNSSHWLQTSDCRLGLAVLARVLLHVLQRLMYRWLHSTCSCVVQVAFPAFRQVQRPSNASLVDYFQVIISMFYTCTVAS